MPPVPRTSAAAVAAEQLDSRLAGLIAQSESLRVDLKSSEAQRRKENLISICIAVLVIIFIVIILAVAVQNNTIARDAKASAEAAESVSKFVADCTTPSGKCYQDGSKRTGGAVTNILKGDIIIAQCNRDFPTDDRKFNDCVVTRMKAAFPAATPAPSPTPSKQ